MAILCNSPGGLSIHAVPEEQQLLKKVIDDWPSALLLLLKCQMHFRGNIRIIDFATPWVPRVATARAIRMAPIRIAGFRTHSMCHQS